MVGNGSYWQIFEQAMLAHLPSISLTQSDIRERKDLISFIRNKLKNRRYTQLEHERYYGKLGSQTAADNSKDVYEGHKENDEGVKQNSLNPFATFSHGYDDYGYYDSGLDLEVFGSYAAGLSLRGSDIDVRVNDFFTYRYLNLEKIGKNLTFEDGDRQPRVWAKSTARLEVIEYFKQAKVPVLQMRDRVTGIQFDVSQGCSAVNKRHIDICRKSQKYYSGLKALILTLKKYLEVRSCHKTFSGGISSFLLFYMVLAYYQNRSQEETKMPDFIGFIHFYVNLDEGNFGLQVDLSHIFNEEYCQNSNFPTIVNVPDFIKNKPNWRGLYIKDPIGKFYYRADPTGVEMHTYRENIGASSFRYSDMVKKEFEDTWYEIEHRTSFEDIITWKSHVTVEIDQDSRQEKKEGCTKNNNNYHEGTEWPKQQEIKQYHEGSEWPPVQQDNTQSIESVSQQQQHQQEYNNSSCQSIINLNVEEVEQIVRQKQQKGVGVALTQETKCGQQLNPGVKKINSKSKGIQKQHKTAQNVSTQSHSPHITKQHLQLLKQRERQQKFKRILDDIENKRQEVN